MMRISVSEIKRHIECPMKCHFEYVLRRGSATKPLALDIGTLIHTALEAKLLKQDWRSAVNEKLNDYAPAEAVMLFEEFDVFAPAIDAWAIADEWEILGTEVEMEVQCGRHVIVGRLDAPIRFNGLRWHLQHKSLAAGIPIPVYVEQQATDWHECVYQRMLEVADPSPVGGTVLNIIRKLSAKRIAESPSDAIIPPQYLARSSETVVATFEDLSQIIDDIADGRDGVRRVVKHRTACAGPFRNSLCIYKSVCDGEDTIESESFVDLEPRYADV